MAARTAPHTRHHFSSRRTVLSPIRNLLRGKKKRDILGQHFCCCKHQKPSASLSLDSPHKKTQTEQSNTWRWRQVGSLLSPSPHEEEKEKKSPTLAPLLREAAAYSLDPGRGAEPPGADGVGKGVSPCFSVPLTAAGSTYLTSTPTSRPAAMGPAQYTQW